MDDNKQRHYILILSTTIWTEMEGDISRFAVRLNTLADWESFKRHEALRAIKYLVAMGYMNFFEKDFEEWCMLTKKGLDALYSEHFLSLYKEEKRKEKNNRYTIAFGVITACGVIFSIVRDSNNKKEDKQPQTIVIQLRQDTLIQVLAPIRIDSFPNRVDSPLQKK